MKIRLITILVLAVAGTLYASPWNNNPPSYHHLCVIEDLPLVDNEVRWFVKAQTQQGELQHYGVIDIVTTELYNSYHIFWGFGDYSGDEQLLLPPGWIVPEDLWERPYKYRRLYIYMPGGCIDMPGFGSQIETDSVFISAGFGHLEPNNDPAHPGLIGYVKSDKDIAPYHRGFCELDGSGQLEKCRAYFTDSISYPLPDEAVISGDSPLYVMAQLLYADSVKAHICLSSTPDSLISFNLIEGDNSWWYGQMANSRLLGL